MSLDHKLTLARNSKFQAELMVAHEQPQPRSTMLGVAIKFASTSRMARRVADLQLAAGFTAMRAELEDTHSIGELRAKIHHWFGKKPVDLVGSPAFLDDDERVADSLVAIKLLASEQRAATVELSDVLRHISIIQRVAADDATLAEPGALRRARPARSPCRSRCFRSRPTARTCGGRRRRRHLRSTSCRRGAWSTHCRPPATS